MRTLAISQDNRAARNAASIALADALEGEAPSLALATIDV